MNKMVKPEIRAGAGMQVRRTRHLQPGGAISPTERHLKSKRTADTPNGAADDSMKIEGKAVARFKGAELAESLTDEQLNRKIAAFNGWHFANGTWWHDELGDGPPMDYVLSLGRKTCVTIVQAIVTKR